MLKAASVYSSQPRLTRTRQAGPYSARLEVLLKYGLDFLVVDHRIITLSAYCHRLRTIIGTDLNVMITISIRRGEAGPKYFLAIRLPVALRTGSRWPDDGVSDKHRCRSRHDIECLSHAAASETSQPSA